ncbi:MAG: hypothetical protein ACXWYP_04125, partial [Pseudonocardia sp.]
DDAEKLGAALAAELLDMAGGALAAQGGSDRSGHDASTPHSVRGGRPAPDQEPDAAEETPGRPAGPPYTLNQE